MSEIEVKLKELKDQLQATEAVIDKKSKERETLNADINDLQKIVNEVNQLVDAFSKAFENIRKSKTELEDYAATKKTMINAALPEEDRKTVGDKIGEVDNNITNKGNEVTTLLQNYEEAKSNFEASQKYLNKKQEEFDLLKTYQKEVDGKLKNLKNLRGLIEKADEENNLPKMYFWINELNTKLDSKNFELKTKDDLKDNLYSAWKELDNAKQACRENEEKMRNAKIELENGQRTLDSLKAKRDTDILDRINIPEGQ